uniref:PP n=1 Tax=Pestalotiopsis theae chrysovirus 1 TaxID=2855487 RepID=A0A6M2VHR2_9VIRU|nr:PP [Pestalotiopsis theae chrysovirus 1]
MNVYKTVYDLAGQAAKGRTFRGRRVDDNAIDEMNRVDGELVEFQMLSVLEKNILSGVSMQDNFTLNENENTIRIGVTSVAHAYTQGVGVSKIEHTSSKELEPFRVHGEWILEHEHGRSGYSEHKGTKSDRDTTIMGKMNRQMTHMSEQEVAGLPRTLVAEIMSQRSDMTHVFMKGFLLLHDLNLSVLFRRKERRARGSMDNYYDFVDSDTRMGHVLERDIVVDSEGFSGDELYTLDLMCQEYPTVKFCEDNIYNTCHMREDSLSIVSSRYIERPESRIPTPVEFYRNLVSVACKLGVVEDFCKAFKMMRGRMSHIRDVNRISQDRRYHSGVRRSVCYYRCMGGSTMHSQICTTFPSYMASSVSLVADMMVGKTYEVAASMMIESFGGLGDLMCEGGPAQSEHYNSIMREYGISSKNDRLNELMLCWESVSETQYSWSPVGTWKPYVEALTDELRKGREVAIPQLTFELPFIHYAESAWGAMIGFTGVDGAGINDLSDIGEGARKKKDEKLRLAATFTWAMGVRQTRPKTFNNSYGTKETSVTTKERSFLKATSGGYKISFVAYTLEEEYQGREDWMEDSATQLIKTTIAGTRCSVIMASGAESRWSYTEMKEPVNAETKTAGITESVMPKPKGDKVDAEVLKLIEEAKKRRDESQGSINDVFAKLRGVTHKEKVKLTGTEMAKDVGDTVKIKEIEVPGDGKCGIHAVVASMKEQGMIKPGQEKLVFDNFDGQMKEETFHDAASLAAAMNEVGIGLRVYDYSSNGVRAITYGDVSENGVAVIRKGMHFSGALEGAGDDVLISGREGGVFTNEQQLAALREMRKFFEG